METYVCIASTKERITEIEIISFTLSLLKNLAFIVIPLTPNGNLDKSDYIFNMMLFVKEFKIKTTAFYSGRIFKLLPLHIL